MQPLTTSLLKTAFFGVLLFSLSQVKASDLTVVPSADLAGKLADVVLPSIYGKEVLNQKPFRITEKDGYWHIDGQLPKAPKGSVMVGGTVHCEIRKTDGAFRNVIHGK